MRSRMTRMVAFLAAAVGLTSDRNNMVLRIPDEGVEVAARSMPMRSRMTEFGGRFNNAKAYRRKRNRRLRGANGGTLPKKYARV